MPLPVETQGIMLGGNVATALAGNPEKFLLYAWQGKSSPGGGNWKIVAPLTVAAHKGWGIPLRSKASVAKGAKRPWPQSPRITLGQPVPPEPPIIMGGGVPELGLTASTKIDPETHRRSDEYQLLRSQPLPAQERSEYQPYPQDVQPGRTVRPGGMVSYSYLSFVWQHLGLQGQLLNCLDKLDFRCTAHYAAADPRQGPGYFGNALRYRIEGLVSRSSIALLVGNLRAVVGQLSESSEPAIDEGEIRQLEGLQEFEQLAAMDRGLSVLYLYPFANLYELAKAEEKAHALPAAKCANRQQRSSQALRELRCLLQPQALQQKLQVYAESA